MQRTAPLDARGVAYLRDRDLATDGDLDHTEARGCIEGAEPENLSPRALERGYDQCGTLGSGNHFLEVQVVDVVFDADAARVMGLEKDMVCVMIHSGSRGLGYQVCDDALKSAPQGAGQVRHRPAGPAAGLRPDRQPRRPALSGRDVRGGQLRLVQSPTADVAGAGGFQRRLRPRLAAAADEPGLRRGAQHRQVRAAHDRRTPAAGVGSSQGATRAFPADHPETPSAYRGIGQPVIIPGDMGRASWVLVGRQGSMDQTFGSCCHGAGRRMSRTAAVKHAQGRRIDQELAAKASSPAPAAGEWGVRFVGFSPDFRTSRMPISVPLLKERSSPLAGREFSGSLAKSRGRLGPLPVRGQ
jgi:tRNA-splicing ligase RtcB (3'-phosphate/5'-hydroxy nucleic acid ligase)